MLAKKGSLGLNPEFSCPASRMTLLSKDTILRGVACNIVKVPAKEFMPFFMLAVVWDWKLEP
jgi:hypothetical protein